MKAPILREPANESYIPAAMVNFAWDMVKGASSYRVTLTDPLGNTLVKEVDFPYDNVNINLSTGSEGRWTWSVQAIDTQGTAGSKSRAWAFYVDRTRPQILSIFPFESTVPSADGGTMVNGQVRVGITFSEEMDITTSPQVFSSLQTLLFQNQRSYRFPTQQINGVELLISHQVQIHRILMVLVLCL